MAGLGFKDFAVGEVLTAADVDGYLMQQTVMRFADSGARGSALGTATGTAVPLAEGMVAYLDNVNRVELFDGSVWRPTGSILQIVSTAKTDVFTASVAAGGVSADAISGSITPISAASKILVIVQTAVSGTAATNHSLLYRDGTVSVYRGDADGSRQRGVGSSPGATVTANGSHLGSVVYLDSPATTSSVTYSIRLAHGETTTQTVYLNRSSGDTNSSSVIRGASSITLMEVAG